MATEQELAIVGDELALAAAYVCTNYDGIHRLRRALANWYDLRAETYSSKGAQRKAGNTAPTNISKKGNK